MTNVSVIQAEQLIRCAIKPARTVVVPLADAVGEVLREPLKADRPLPPFDRVMMDGIALSFDAWKRGCREFRIEGIQPAGVPSLFRHAAVGCIEVMTGAMLPRGCDCVVPVEEIETRDGWVRITGDVTRGQFIHRAGSDARRGKVLVPPGKVLDGPAIAVAASVGKTRLRVAQRPAIAIVSTGNELVDVGERPLPHQIRLSNSHALAASLRLRGFRNVTFHRTGDAPPEQVLRRTLKADIVLLTGGVSKGRFDVVPEMLKRLGVREVFHRVRQRPGKPLWFGVATALCRREGADAPTERGGYNTLVFGLPGNPVSCLVCLHRYVLPLLVGTDRRAVRRETARRARRSRPTIVLTKPVRQGSLTVFLPVNNGVLVNLNTSGDFADLAKSDGFVEIPEGTGYVRRVRYWSWK